MKKGEYRKCIICSKDFYISKSQAFIRVGKYCSYLCMNIGKNTGSYIECLECKKKFYLKKNIEKKQNMGKYCSMICYRTNKAFNLEKKCLFCNNIYIVNKQAKINSKYCSRDCKDKYSNKGKTSLDKLERVKFSQTIQKKVLKRDDYTCQLCGQRGGNLQVDHIQPWAGYVELRFIMNNCRTLCMECHYKITWGKSMPENIKTWGHNIHI